MSAPLEPVRISVIIPLYNKEKTITGAIESVLKQSVSPFEIIVVDDGSTDRSANLASSVRSEKIRLIRQANRGVSAARNRGIAEAESDWVAFLDADDTWEIGFLLEIQSLINTYPDVIGAGTSYFLQEAGGEKKKGVHINRIPFTGDDGILHNYFEVAVHSVPPVCASAVCVRKSALAGIGGFPEGVIAGEDLLTWARLAIQGNFAYSLKPLAVFRQGKGRTYDAPPSRVPDPKDFVGKELRNLYTVFTGRQRKWLKVYVGLWHKMRASVYLRLGMDRQALKEILSTFRYHSLNVRLFAYLVMLFLPLRFRSAMFRKLSG